MKLVELKKIVSFVNEKYFVLFGPLTLLTAMTLDKYAIGWIFLFIIIVFSISKIIELI